MKQAPSGQVVMRQQPVLVVQTAMTALVNTISKAFVEGFHQALVKLL
jgi:hypothetical protein